MGFLCLPRAPGAMPGDPHTRRLMWFVFAGSRGGPNRARLVRRITESPANANQLAGALGIDYKAVQHHLRVLEKNGMVERAGGKYGAAYFASGLLESNMESFRELDKGK